MVPDAPIDGKLPSVKPEDRSGDFTFSRGSNLAATRVNKDGLIEKGGENLLLQSNQFDTTWTNTSSAETSGFEGYDGTNNAWKLEKTGNGGRLRQTISLSGVNTFSVYAKAGTAKWLRLLFETISDSYYFDLENGVLGSSTSQPVDGNIESVGNGWYRCSVTGSGTIGAVRIYPADDDLDVTGTSGSIYIQDAQLEQGLVATEYIETTTATVQKGILENLPRIDYSGGASCPSLLLEPQRTQLIPQSEYFGGTQWPVDGVSLDANNATSPEGLQNAYKITDDISTGYHKITKTNVFAADGTMRTWSVFVKKGNARYCVISHAEIFSSYVNSLIFDMQEGVYTNEGTTNYFDIVQEPIDMGNGWWRIGFSSDLNSSSYDNFSIGISRGADWLNNASYTGDGSLNFYIYGAQCELGSYPTSYIPAYGSSVTRSLDETNSLNISSFTDGVNYSLFFEIKNNDSLIRDNSSGGIRLRNRNASASSIRIYRASNSSIRNAIVFIDESGAFNPAAYVSSATETLKLCFTKDGSTGLFTIYENGVKVREAANLNYLNMNEIYISGSGSTADVKSLLYFDTTLTDDECIALTTI